MSSNGHQQLIMKQGKATINKDQLAERNDKLNYSQAFYQQLPMKLG